MPDEGCADFRPLRTPGIIGAVALEFRSVSLKGCRQDPTQRPHKDFVGYLAQNHPDREPALPAALVLKDPSVRLVRGPELLHVRKTAGLGTGGGEDALRILALGLLSIRVLDDRGHGLRPQLGWCE